MFFAIVCTKHGGKTFYTRLISVQLYSGSQVG
jgi:hypothetical protein